MERSRRLTLLVTVFATFAGASLLGNSVSTEDIAIPLPLTLNEVAKGDIVAVMRGDDVMVAAADLERSGLTGAMWQRLLAFTRLSGASDEINGAELISLKAVRPFVTFRFDESALTLSVTADPRLLTPTRLDARGGLPADIIYSHDTSTFLNYSVNSTYSQPVSFSAETGTSIGGSLLLNSFSRPSDGSFVRLSSSYIVDQRGKLRRWTFGDAPVRSDVLGGSALLGGVTVTRNFTIDPYFVRYPSLDFRGTALTPSRVDVYVNGALVLQQNIPPGGFDLRNLPVSAGAGTARVVVRDVFGREHVASEPYYYSTQILARGLSEYVYSAGFLRKGFGIESFDYGAPAGIAFHRRGVTDNLTVGGRLEVSRDLVSGGPTVSGRTRLGDLDLTIGLSEDGGRTGHAGEVGYRYLGRRMSFGVFARKSSREYANFSTRREADRPLLDSNAFVSFRAGRASLSLLWNTRDMRDQLDTQRQSLTANIPISRRSNLFTSLGRADQGLGWKPEILAGLSIFLGAQTAASTTMTRIDGRTELVSEIQRSLPVGSGFGYRVIGTSARGESTGNAALQYQTSFGRYDVEFNSDRMRQRPGFSAAGGLVYAKRSFFATRPVQESFAVIRVPGVHDVRVYANNQLIGRTDRRGHLLVANLLSYYGNRLSIDDRDIPMDYDVRDVEQTIAPPYRGGAIVEFPVQQIRTVTGSLVIRTATAQVIPEFGELTVTTTAGDAYVSPIGRGGDFYLENIAAGTHRAVIEYADGKCQFQLQIPNRSEPVMTLGLLTCSNEGTKP